MLKIDPEFQNLIPEIGKEELEILEKSVIEKGVTDPLVVWGETGILLDGHNRFKICTDNDLQYPIRKISLPDRDAAVVWIIDNQLGRRNLEPFDKVPLAERKRGILERQARERQATSEPGVYGGKPLPEKLPEAVKGDVRDQLAKSVGVSGRTYDRYVKVLNQGTPDLVEAVKSKAVGSVDGARIADLPQEEQRKAISDVLTKKENKALTTQKRGVANEYSKSRSGFTVAFEQFYNELTTAKESGWREINHDYARNCVKRLADVSG